METASVLTRILEVFAEVGTWISTAVTSMIPMFYDAEAGLTFLGVLAVAGLAFSVVFLNSVGHCNGDIVDESALIAGNS